MSASANGGGRENKKSEEEEEEEERRGVIDIMDQGDAFTPPDGGVWVSQMGNAEDTRVKGFPSARVRLPFILAVPLSARFCLGRWDLGRIG